MIYDILLKIHWVFLCTVQFKQDPKKSYFSKKGKSNFAKITTVHLTIVVCYKKALWILTIQKQKVEPLILTKAPPCAAQSSFVTYWVTKLDFVCSNQFSSANLKTREIRNILIKPFLPKHDLTLRNIISYLSHVCYSYQGIVLSTLVKSSYAFTIYLSTFNHSLLTRHIHTITSFYNRRMYILHLMVHFDFNTRHWFIY